MSMPPEGPSEGRPDSQTERRAERPPATRPVFLERRSYRLRRRIDAARLLPLLGSLLMALPLLWPQVSPAEGGVPTSRAMLYIFGVWAGLALVAALLARRLPEEALEAYDAGRGDAPEPPARGGV